MTITHDALDLTMGPHYRETPSREYGVLHTLCSQALTPLLPDMADHGTGTPDTSKLLYYEARTVGKFCCVSLLDFGVSLVSDQIVQLLPQVLCLAPYVFQNWLNCRKLIKLFHFVKNSSKSKLTCKFSNIKSFGFLLGSSD